LQSEIKHIHSFSSQNIPKEERLWRVAKWHSVIMKSALLIRCGQWRYSASPKITILYLGGFTVIAQGNLQRCGSSFLAYKALSSDCSGNESVGLGRKCLNFHNFISFPFAEYFIAKIKEERHWE
jgi:hypothetical protein